MEGWKERGGGGGRGGGARSIVGLPPRQGSVSGMYTSTVFTVLCVTWGRGMEGRIDNLGTGKRKESEVSALDAFISYTVGRDTHTHSVLVSVMQRCCSITTPLLTLCDASLLLCA